MFQVARMSVERSIRRLQVIFDILRQGDELGISVVHVSVEKFLSSASLQCIIIV